jgi:maleate isomerase
MKIRAASTGQGDAFAPQSAFRRVGLLLLDSDLSTEADVTRLLAGSGLRVHAARMAFGGATSSDTLAALGPRIAEAAALLPPGEPLAAVGFACTSATAVLGEGAVADAIGAAVPGAAAVTPLWAAAAALGALGARRVSILAPYVEDAARAVAGAIAGAGFDVVSLDWMGLTDDRQMARLRPERIVDLAAAAVAPDADALFVSCTALRAAETAGAIEARVGRPVITSNQALAWALLRLAGHEAGRLWSLPWPEEAA